MTVQSAWFCLEILGLPPPSLPKRCSAELSGSPTPAARTELPPGTLEQTPHAGLGLPWGARAQTGKVPENWGVASVSPHPGSGLRKGEELVLSPCLQFSSLRPQVAFAGPRAPVVRKRDV